jgi:segregation and condensation protein A
VVSKAQPINQIELAAAAKAPRLDNVPQQDEMPFAVVQGKAVSVLPRDLYIPPDALEIILEAFEGPMDLLLYLIRRQNLDILDIDVAEITRQYMGYIQLMQEIQLELAADYLVMAAMLAEIKSRMLLPRQSSDEEEAEDPRVELIKRLQEYERFKRAAEDIDQMPRLGRDVYQASVEVPDRDQRRPHPEVDIRDILTAFAVVLQRAEMYESHQVEFETLSTRERMSDILRRLGRQSFASFESLFTQVEGRHGVVVTFLAVMELIKESLIDIVQTESFGPIHITAKTR